MKNMILLLVALSVATFPVVGQIPPNNLGQIVEVATPAGILPVPHVLIGWDSTGMVRQANSTDSFKVFSRLPSQTTLNRITTEQYPLNYYTRFSAPTGSESYEIHFGDSSYYWNGSVLAPDKLPFAVYAVGPRSSFSQDTTVSHRLCIERNYQGYYLFYSDMALPWDSTYCEMGTRSTIPFSTFEASIRYWRTGKASIPYTQTTWTQATDSITPPPGTVIRLVAANVDSARPVIAARQTLVFPNPADTFQLMVYSFEPVTWSLISAPENMTLDASGVIRWPYVGFQYGQSYNVILGATNSLGVTYASFTAVAGYSGAQPLVRLKHNNLDFWTANDGTVAANTPASQAGMLFNSPSADLIYAGGFYVGTRKQGEGTPDTVTVSNVEFSTEFQPGRILNSGNLGTLITEDPMDPALGVYLLPDHAADWPLEAPHDELGNPLKLSLRDSWTVFNDLAAANDSGWYETSPKLGLEIQRQTFMFSAYPWNNAVLVRMRIINKSDRTYDSTYFALWQDPDVGYSASQDIASVDSALSLVMTANAPGVDACPVASGGLLLQGPLCMATSGDTAIVVDVGQNGFTTLRRPQKLTRTANAAIAYRNGQGGPDSEKEDVTRYNFFLGLDPNGVPKSGGPFDIWTGVIPGDQRTIMSSGPFTFTAGDTQTIWYAYVGALGANDSAAVDTLKHYATLMHQQFQGNMNDIVVGIGERTGQQVPGFKLYANYPNPFNPSTTIRYNLPKESRVSLKIYNVLGQEVRTLVNAWKGIGEHTVVWDGRNNWRHAVSSGVYLYRLEVDGKARVRKMMLIR